MIEKRMLAGLALLLAIVSVYDKRQADPDLWGHLRYGRFFAENGLEDLSDPFAYTSAGLTWHAHEWLSQWLLWQSYALGGPPGLIVFKCLVGGAAIYFLYRTIRLGSDDARIWAPVLILTAGMVGRWFLFRPQLFTFCFFAYFTFVLFGHLLGRSARLWTLPLVLALWANLHGGFLAGLGALGLALGLRLVQAYNRTGLRPHALWSAAWPLGLTLVAGTAATLLTPFGLDLWRYLLTELSHDTNRLYIDEWMPLLRFDAHTWTILTTFLLLGALLFAGLLAQARTARVVDVPPWVWLLTCLPLTWMAFGSIRHVPVLTLWSAPVLSLLAQAAAQQWGVARLWQTGWLAVTGLIGLPALLTVYFVCSNPLPRIAVGRYPSGVVAFLRVNDLHGNVYAPLTWGSYLTWELYPAVRVAMDGRNVTLFPSALVRQNLTYYLLEGVDTEVPLHCATDYLLVPVRAPVVNLLRDDPRWQKMYEDAEEVLFLRADERHADVLRRHRSGELTQSGCAAPAYLE